MSRPARSSPASVARGTRAGRTAILRYALGWTVASVALAAVALLALRDDVREVSLPPVRETQLADAAQAAGCTVLRGTRRRRLQPPVTGPPAPPARPEVYTRPPEVTALVGAMRRGVVVIHYHPPLDGERADQLRRVRDAVPAGTIVTPNADMGYAVAVTAWRRLLACPRFDDRSLDAIRLFRGRYIGSGPER